MIPAKTTSGTLNVDTAGVPGGEVCSSQAGLKDLCVSQLKPAIGSGLQSMLGGYLKGGAGPAYTAVFRMIELSHSPTSGAAAPTVQITMRWQFELLDGDRKIVQLAQTTVGPEQLNHVDAADKAIAALLNAVFEAIADALDKAEWQPSPAPPPAPAPAPPGPAS